MAKVLPLEGPHKKHKSHGPDASVPHQGLGPVAKNEHWEKQYSYDPKVPNNPATAFLPKCAKNRPQPHPKVNETDH